MHCFSKKTDDPSGSAAGEISKNQILDVFRERKSTPCIFNVVCGEHRIMDGVAVVQAFAGTDAYEISKTTKALQYMLKSTSMPSDWIFVESQRLKSDASFGWVSKFGMKYRFVPAGEWPNLPPKSSLWSAAQEFTAAHTLVFVDSDSMFCNSSWLDETVRLLESGHDVVSPAGWMYTENGGEDGLVESAGHVLMSNGGLLTDENCRCGIAMRRECFENRISGFPLEFVHPDLACWARIAGSGSVCIEDRMKTRHESAPDPALRIGSTEQVMCRFEKTALR